LKIPETCGPAAVRGPETRAQRATRAQRGATLAAVLVCLLVIMLFSAAVVRNLTLRHRALSWEQRDLQCLYLLTSATDRAQTRLAADPAYTGESWDPSEASGGAGETGVAHIRVEASAELPDHYRVSIEALWPDDPVHRARRTTELLIRKKNLSNAGETP
jgi:hypothetical protein